MKNTKSTKITIKAEVSTIVYLGENETIDDLKDRSVDICLHGFGQFSEIEKEDLGCDTYSIEETGKEEKVTINRSILAALIDTVKNSTDLDNVYNNATDESFSIESIIKIMKG